jgi:hypothetical protein
MNAAALALKIAQEFPQVSAGRAELVLRLIADAIFYQWMNGDASGSGAGARDILYDVKDFGTFRLRYALPRMMWVTVGRNWKLTGEQNRRRVLTVSPEGYHLSFVGAPVLLAAVRAGE